jgi:uncharacterized protein YegJ (DUF2314 family)
MTAMKKVRRYFGLIPLLFLGALPSCSKKGYTPTISIVPTADPEMVAAIAKARDSLPGFWQTFQNPKHGETNFTIKVRFSDTNGQEYVWLGDISREDKRVFGRVGGAGLTVRCIKEGQRVPIDEVDIADWSYERDGKIFGNYTVRALFKVMPQRDVDYFKRRLAEP